MEVFQNLETVWKRMMNLETPIKLIIMAMMMVSAFGGMIVLYGFSPEPKAVTYCTSKQMDAPYCLTGNEEMILNLIRPKIVMNLSEDLPGQNLQHPCIIIKQENCTNSGTLAPPICPECPACQKTECPACESCQICQTCAKIDYQDIKTARPDCEGSACSDGYMRMKKRCMVDVGLKPSTFAETPFKPYPAQIPGAQSLVCFKWIYGLEGHAFAINATGWNMRNESDQGRYYLWEVQQNATMIAAFRNEVRYNETQNQTGENNE